MKNNLAWRRLLGSAWLLCALGCGDTVDDITDSVQCDAVCERYSSCFDADYDVEGCTDRCESDASASQTRQERLRSCDACMDERSCTEATFECSADCVGIVP